MASLDVFWGGITWRLLTWYITWRLLTWYHLTSFDVVSLDDPQLSKLPDLLCPERPSPHYIKKKCAIWWPPRTIYDSSPTSTPQQIPSSCWKGLRVLPPLLWNLICLIYFPSGLWLVLPHPHQTHNNTHSNTHTCTPQTHTHHTRMYTCEHVRVHAHTHMHTHNTHTHTHTHTHTTHVDTHTHAHILLHFHCTRFCTLIHASAW